ncbi:MAG: DUF4145 domain-containing protein [Thermodesulfobacteriota bacterium]
MTYTSPEFNKRAFNCPICNAFSNMVWGQLSHSMFQGWTRVPHYIAYCVHCKKYSYWQSDPHGIAGKMILPMATIAPLPHLDMPDSVKYDYEEAREISTASPRGAAALLRLSIQKLCKELGESGKNINDDIASLVKKGLPVEIQQALDIIRVVGNNAVHPGELSSDDVSEVAASLFELINVIVEERISKPKKLQKLFDMLPEGARKGIENRDKK